MSTKPTEMQANGAFIVELLNRSIQNNFDEDRFSQMGIEKTFTGDITGISKGEMLALHGHIEGSAGYVAIEQIEGTLHNKKGSFALQHSCVMNNGTDQQNLTVIPDSGTEELAGIQGRMTIERDAEGKHSYSFVYVL